MAPKTITLYHGGDFNQIADLLGAGLNHKQPFYCTRDRALAQEAKYGHGLEGTLLEVEVPSEVFENCLSSGYWVEKPYFGCIQIDNSREVIIHPGEGIEIMNRYLFRY
jgi:hypothetical protein